MGRRKVVSVYRGRYKGDYLTEADCDKLESIREAYEDGVFFGDLKGYLYDIPKSDVENIKYLASSDDLKERPKGELTDSQTVMLAFGLVSKKWLCGDSVGLGKTALMAATYNYLKANRGDKAPRMLFLVDGEDVMNQNCDQLIRFTSDYFMAVTGRKQSAQNLVDFYLERGYLPNVVGTHSLLRQPVFQELVSNYIRSTGKDPFGIVVIDESAVLGNSNTQVYKQAQSLFSEVEYRICLNATEFDVKLEEFYNQLNWVDTTLLPTRTQFKKDYYVMEWNPWTGYSKPSGKYKNAEDFRNKVGYRYLARTRKDLGATMKDCSAEIVEVPTNDYQKALLRETSMAGMALNCPWAIDQNADMSEEFCPKLKTLGDILDKDLGFADSEDVPQVLIYAHNREAQAGIAALLGSWNISNRVLNGDTPSEERHEIVEGFKDNKFSVLITNVQRGLNFGNCNFVIFYQFPSVGKAVQFEGRITRQENIVGKHVYILLSAPKELKRFKTLLADRAKALNAFASTDYSMLLGLLLKDKNSAEV